MRSAHVQPPLTVNSKSERKVNSLPPLGFKLVIIGMLAHLSNHSTKSHPYDKEKTLTTECSHKAMSNFCMIAATAILISI
jgi:hypothetical protein